MPPSGGTNLGTAQGQIVITANTAPAQAQMQAFAQEMQSIGARLNQIGSIFGVQFGAQTARQLAEAAIGATEAATAYDRQRVAAASLAGSQAQLNDMLAVYDKATGGILDKTTELANVTQLMSVGFADSSQELEKFAGAIRGISIATGRSSDIITQNLILELFSQRGQRLDQLGLQYDKVRAKADELQKADSNLTQQQAYQNAVLEEAQRKYGDLAKSAAGAATGLEKASKAASDAKLAIGEVLSLPVNTAGLALAVYIQGQIDLLHGWERAWQDLRNAMLRATGFNVPTGMTQRFVELSAGRDIGRHSGTGASTDISEGQQKINDAIVEHAHKQFELTQQTNQDLDDENNSYQANRLRSQRNYDEQVTRSAADFAKQQVRQEEDYQNSIAMLKREAAQRDLLAERDHNQQIAMMQRDSGQQLQHLAEERDRTIATRQADYAERIGKLQIEHTKDIAQKQEDSTKRLLQIDKDFNRQREQAALSHQNALSDAAARLDAFAIFAEQQRFATEQKNALQSHDDKVKDEKDKLQESIDNANEAYTQKLSDEKDSLDKAIKQANDSYTQQATDQKAALAQRISDANTAYAQQLSDAHDADTQRLTDMGTAFEAQKTRQGQDQTDRMTQMGLDHTAEMTQFETEHGNRITQIQTHAGLERTALDTAFTDQLTALGVHNTAWEKEQDAFQTFALQSYKDHRHDMEREAINAEIRELKAARLNPLTDPAQLTLINNAITALGQILAQIPARVGTDNNPYVPQITQDDSGNRPLHGSAIISSASVTLPPAAQVSTSGNNTSVTIASGAIVISGVSGQTATDLAGIIDQRIYNAVLRATGRG